MRHRHPNRRSGDVDTYIPCRKPGCSTRTLNYSGVCTGCQRGRSVIDLVGLVAAS